MKISDLREDDKDLTVPFGKGAIKVVYSPMQYTIDDIERVQARPEAERLRGFAEMIVQTIKSWDLEMDGEPDIENITDPVTEETTAIVRRRYIPLDTDSICRNVPVRILAAIMTAIQKETAPDPEA